MVVGVRRDGAALPKVEKPATVLDLGAVDVQALRARVERMSEKAWSLDDARKESDFDCFDHTRHVIFRFIHGNQSPLRCTAAHRTASTSSSRCSKARAHWDVEESVPV